MPFVLKISILQNYFRGNTYQRLIPAITTECQNLTVKHGKSFSPSLWRTLLCNNTSLFFFFRKNFFFKAYHTWLANRHLILQKKKSETIHTGKKKKKRIRFYGSHLGKWKLELNSLAWSGQELKYQPPVYSRQLHRALNLGAEEVSFCISKKTSKYFSVIQTQERSLFKLYNNRCSRNLMIFRPDCH